MEVGVRQQMSGWTKDREPLTPMLSTWQGLALLFGFFILCLDVDTGQFNEKSCNLIK